MTAISSLDDEQVDDLLAGRAPDGRPELVPLAELATAVRWRAESEPTPVMRYPLRHAVARRMAPAEPRRTVRLAHAALSGAAIAVLAVAGAADALPAPVQQAMADVGGLVGIHVPVPSDHDGFDPDAPPSFAEAEEEGTEPKAFRPPAVTPAGAVPADPGTPGDQDPATPAIPPEPEADEHAASPTSDAVDSTARGVASSAPGSDNATPDAAGDDDGEGTAAGTDQGADDGEDQRADRADESAGHRPPLGNDNSDE